MVESSTSTVAFCGIPWTFAHIEERTKAENVCDGNVDVAQWNRMFEEACCLAHGVAFDRRRGMESTVREGTLECRRLTRVSRVQCVSVENTREKKRCVRPRALRVLDDQWNGRTDWARVVFGSD